jgi:two-component sensor histidine kinase
MVPAEQFEAIGRGVSWPARASTDFIDRLMGLTDRVPQYSASAVLIAVAAVLAATALRALTGFAGEDLRLAAYCPAVLAAGLVAGPPAAILVVILSGLSAAFVFLPPYFAWVEVVHESAFVVYGMAAGLIILFAHWCRLVIARAKEQQKAYETVARELAHRSRNSAAVIQAIVQKSLEDQPEVAIKILGRVRAAQSSNEVLIRHSSQTAYLHALLGDELMPYGEARVSISGPSIKLTADQSRHLIMLFHELATNAAKYGALSGSAGKLDVIWKVDKGAVTLRWNEQGGPAVAPPERTGFGSTLIRQCLRALGGTFECDYAPQGLSCVLGFPLEKGVASGFL